MSIWPFGKKMEKKAVADNLLQYQGGIYYIGSSTAGSQRLKQYVEGYRICDTIYSCVNLITQSAVLVPWYVYRDTADGDVEEVEKHPLLEWMDKPGPGMDWTEFMTRSLSFYLTAGNSYWHKMVGSFGKYGQVEVLRPQNMSIKVDTRNAEIMAYEYRVGGQVISFPPKEIIHVKTFHPEDPLYGLSPIQVLARKVDISNFGELWTIALLENEARPSGGLKIKTGVINEEQRQKINQMLKDQFSGYNNAGRPLVLSGDWEWQSFSITPKELEFLHSKKAVMREICAAYKVAPELFGDSENKTYSNVKEARKALYQEAVLPLLGKFKNALNEYLVPQFDDSGVYLDYDVSGIDALTEDLGLLWTRIKDAKINGIITRDEARDEMGYGELEGGDTLSEPMGSTATPVDELGKTPKPKPVPAPLAEEVPPKPATIEEPKPKKSASVIVKGGGFWTKAERKRAKWNAFRRRTLAREKTLNVIAQKYLNAQADRIIDAVKRAPSVNMVDRWLIMDKRKEASLYVDATMLWYMDTFKQAMAAGMAASKGEILEHEVKAGVFTPEHEEKLKKKILYTGEEITETSFITVWDLIEEAEAEAMTMDELARAIRDKWKDLGPMRARRIAMTEAARIENYGELEGYKETEFVDSKGWICSFLEHSREAHIQADANYRDNPIPLDEPFIVGGESMMEPLDDSLGATAGNIINCHCAMFPHVKED